VNALEFTDLRTGISSLVHQSFVFIKCSNILIAEFCSNTENRISPFTENVMCEKKHQRCWKTNWQKLFSGSKMCNKFKE